ncbi:MAG: hypothetical protein IID45_06140 [Planctomycetes bacterium]|nr:hypothetical protein [Planctomycetota bacterium]
MNACPRVCVRRALICLFCLAAGMVPMQRRACAADEKNAAKDAYGQRIVLSGVVTPMFVRELERAAKECLRRAKENGTQAVLLIELHRGNSRYGLVRDIAKFLIDLVKDDGVRTVAWIPKGQEATGNNAIIALACNDIYMHPDATIGDIGNGERAEDDVHSFVSGLVKNRHNPLLNMPIVRAMMEPALIVKKVTIRKKPGGPIVEVRFVTDRELANLKKTDTTFEVSEPAIKEGDEFGKFTGSKASSNDFLIKGMRETLDQVAADLEVSPRLFVGSRVQGKNQQVALIRVSGVIDPVLETFLQRQIDRCINDGKSMIIFEITSPGGLFKSSQRLSNRIRNLNPEKIKTVAYIPDQATNRAALIALACDEIYMSPHAQIGNITVRADDDDDDQTSIRGQMEATLRDLAEKKHRSPAL